MVRNKSAKVLRGEALEHAVRAIGETHPELVRLQMSIPQARDYLAGTRGRGRRYAIEPAEWPAERARAVMSLGPRASQRRIGEFVGVDEKTVRNYDRRERDRLRRSPLRNAPDGRDGA
jgi:hypothetical protein